MKNAPLYQQYSTSSGGVDWLELSCVVLWARPEMLFDRLEQLKQTAQKGEDGIFHRLGATFEVQPSGHGVKGNFYPWVIKAEGFTFRVKSSNREGDRNGQCNLHVVATGATCTEFGGRACWSRIKKLVQLLGGRIVANKVSRLDVCADLPEVDIADFGYALMRQHVVTRSTRSSIHFEHFEAEGVELGRGDIRCRGYCKTKEIKQKKDTYALERMQRIRWGGKTPEKSMRVEFQLRRKALVSLGVDSISDWFAKSGTVCAYLTHDWIRIVDRKVDKKNRNQSRALIVPWWTEVQKAFFNWAGCMTRAVRTHKQGQVDMEHLTVGGIGCLLSVVASECGGLDDPEEIAAELAVRVADFIKDNPEYVKESLKRKCARNVTSGKMRLVGAA